MVRCDKWRSERQSLLLQLRACWEFHFYVFIPNGNIKEGRHEFVLSTVVVTQLIKRQPDNPPMKYGQRCPHNSVIQHVSSSCLTHCAHNYINRYVQLIHIQYGKTKPLKVKDYWQPYAQTSHWGTTAVGCPRQHTQYNRQLCLLLASCSFLP
jgi:hypothetical protein